MMTRRRKTTEVNLDFAFFDALRQFYVENRGFVRTHYRDLSKRFLDFNDPQNATAYLRVPQFEALEMYVLLKELLDNAPVHQIFDDWRNRRGYFQGRTVFQRAGQVGLFEQLTEEQYGPAFELLADQLTVNQRSYANYIFALTMGTGKTILMATCIFYEFILANKFPKDHKYCHNALVFAPDTTVLEALREIMTFDMSKVVPPEYVNFLSTNIKFHFLDEAGMTLNLLDRSRFNVIISNTQKIILKRQHREKSPIERLMDGGPAHDPDSVYAQNADLYGFDVPEDEAELTTNQRFQKLQRLSQLGIYVDEAHHAFGKNLARDVGAIQDTRKTSLRLTIDELAKSLERANTHVVACYNYTGTPYAEKDVLPEVVYSYGLQEAIDKGYLKLVRINGYENTRTADFVRLAVDDFLAEVGDARHEGLLPKMAFFAATIDELQNELRPALEAVLADRSISLDSILVNVGDDKITSSDDIREFNRLDTPSSEKRFILLVGKGREGWNCRSLFSVALFRQPTSKIFVLQATMRCLRAIGEGQQTGHVYLSADNVRILEDELANNFRLTVDDIQTPGRERQLYRVLVKSPPERVKLKRVRNLYRMREKEFEAGTPLALADAPRDKYRVIHTERSGLTTDGPVAAEDITAQINQRHFSRLTLVAEIARYLNKPCLDVEQVLARTEEGIDAILEAVNEFEQLLYDWVIPRLFRELYDMIQYRYEEEDEVLLTKIPERGYYEVTAIKGNVVSQADVTQDVERSFHLDPYCFDSTPERDLFWRLFADERIQKVYFTGMLTHGQSEFFIQYIDPESHTLRSYYPDFLFQKEDGSWVIVEVKGDNKVDDPVVQAKAQFAEQLAVASGMKYKMLPGSWAAERSYDYFFNGEPLPKQAELV